MEVKPLPSGRVVCVAQPTTVSSSAQTRPPCTIPMELYADSSGAQVNTTLPDSTDTMPNCISLCMGGGGSCWSMTARTRSKPAIGAPNAAVGSGSCQVITRDFWAPQPCRRPSLGVTVIALLSAAWKESQSPLIIRIVRPAADRLTGLLSESVNRTIGKPSWACAPPGLGTQIPGAARRWSLLSKRQSHG